MISGTHTEINSSSDLEFEIEELICEYRKLKGLPKLDHHEEMRVQDLIYDLVNEFAEGQ